MKSRIKLNGLRHDAIYRLFPMVFAITSDGGEATVEHSDDLVLPPDADVDRELLQQKWDKIRQQRAPLLREADWLVSRAEDQGVGVDEARTYRQALRDVTKQPDPENVIWPTKP
jgi:hypothetical protein